MHRFCAIAAAVIAFAGAPALAQTWTLENTGSRLAFGSIKKDKIGEVHSFEQLTGAVAADGTASISIDLTSVQTNIEIRDTRMMEHVFKGAKTATIAAKIDMNDVRGLKAGETTTTVTKAVLSFLGQDIPMEAELFVARLSEKRVMVATNDMLFLGMADAGLTPAIDKLMEIAKLPGITRTAPVTLRLMFQMDGQRAASASAIAATPVAAKSTVGDTRAGRKVFAKCKACHKLDKGKRSIGPHLNGIFGRTAGSITGFKYSKAMKASGVVWTDETLAAFLAKPKKFMPRNRMAFPGLRSEKDIQNVIAYLRKNASR